MTGFFAASSPDNSELIRCVLIMTRFSIILIFSLSVFIISCTSKADEKNHVALNDEGRSFLVCLSKSSATNEKLSNCYRNEIKRQDARLNQNYQHFLATRREDARQRYVEAQRQWIKFRDTNCNAQIANAVNEDAELIAGDRCYLKMTINRADELASSTPLTGSWYGESEKNGTLNVTLLQHGDDVTGTYCYMNGTEQIDCPDDNPHILHGRVSGNTVLLSFPSSSGEPDRRKARVTLKGANLSWQLVEDPDAGLMPTPVSFDTLLPLP